MKTTFQLKPSLKQKPAFSASFAESLNMMKLSNQQVRQELIRLFRPNPWIQFDDQKLLEFLQPNSGSGILNDLYYQLNTASFQGNPAAAAYILESLDEHGFYDPHQETPFSSKDIEEALKLIQGFEPIGIALPNSTAFVCLQLKNQGEELALRLMLECEELILNHDISGILKFLHITQDELNNAFETIRQCSLFSCTLSEERNIWLKPDVSLTIEEDELIITPAMKDLPQLTIPTEQLSPQARQYLKRTHLVLDMLNQRNLTTLQIFHALIEIQHDHFLKGVPLRPCRLEDISLLTGISISTISRLCRTKFYQFDGKLFPFSVLLASGNIQGKSHDELHQIVLDILQEEDPAAPYKDEMLIEILKEQGITLSRRGLAKLRKKWNIPNSYQRKRG